MPDYTTVIELHQAGVSHEVAFQHALDAAETLVRAGFDVQLKPTLSAEMLESGTCSPGWHDEDTEEDAT